MCLVPGSTGEQKEKLAKTSGTARCLVDAPWHTRHDPRAVAPVALRAPRPRVSSRLLSVLGCAGAGGRAGAGGQRVNRRTTVVAVQFRRTAA